MGYYIKSLVVVLFAMLIMVSCKDDSKESGGDFPDEIQGVWQEEGYDDGDEIGLYISGNEIGYWDYLGDEFDQGDDCYFNEVMGELVSYDGDNYRIRLTSEWAEEAQNSEGVLILRLDSKLLHVTYPDEENYEETYSKDSRSIGGLTPACSFQSKANIKAEKIM